MLVACRRLTTQRNKEYDMNTAQNWATVKTVLRENRKSKRSCADHIDLVFSVRMFGLSAEKQNAAEMTSGLRGMNMCFYQRYGKHYIKVVMLQCGCKRQVDCPYETAHIVIFQLQRTRPNPSRTYEEGALCLSRLQDDSFVQTFHGTLVIVNIRSKRFF